MALDWMGPAPSGGRLARQLQPSAMPEQSSHNATASGPPRERHEQRREPWTEETAERSAPLVDSHCHLIFDRFAEDIDAVAERWRAAGVKALVHACVEPGEIGAIRAMADRFPEVRYAVGLHPLDAGLWQDDVPTVLREAAEADERVVAIGELGMDLFKASDIERQTLALEAQLDLAEALDLPVIVHCRDAAAPMLTLLERRCDRGRRVRGVMHCWGGNPAEMKAFLDLGFFISFSGTVSFSKATQIHACARQVPEDRYMVETDCPFLAPVPRRGKRNEPAFVAHVARRVAALRDCGVEEVRRVSSRNAAALFGLESLLS